MTVHLALPTATRIGWIGTGVMGSSMCGHVLTAGYRVSLCSRTKAKAQPLVDLGATWADDPRTVAAQSDMIFTMVAPNQERRSRHRRVRRLGLRRARRRRRGAHDDRADPCRAPRERKGEGGREGRSGRGSSAARRTAPDGGRERRAANTHHPAARDGPGQLGPGARTRW